MAVKVGDQEVTRLLIAEGASLDLLNDKRVSARTLIEETFGGEFLKDCLLARQTKDSAKSQEDTASSGNQSPQAGDWAERSPSSPACPPKVTVRCQSGADLKKFEDKILNFSEGPLPEPNLELSDPRHRLASQVERTEYVP